MISVFLLESFFKLFISLSICKWQLNKDLLFFITDIITPWIFLAVIKIHNFLLLKAHGSVSILSEFIFRRHFIISFSNFEKIILTFIFVWFYNCYRRRKYKLNSFVYRFQAFNLNSKEYLRFTNCYWKVNKIRISWHSETWLDIDCLLVSQ